MGIVSKIKYPQEIDDTINLTEDYNVIKCYEHFSKRCIERFNTNYSLIDYINVWIYTFRGQLVTKNQNKMIRLIGNYYKDEDILCVIYTKHNFFDFYLPITIFEITEYKKKFRLYKSVLINKKNNIQF